MIGKREARAARLPQAFSAACDDCGKFLFRSDIQPVTLQHPKTGEVASFDMCPACRGKHRDRINADAGAAYGVSSDVVKRLRIILASTVSASHAKSHRKFHVIGLDHLLRLWAMQDGVCALTGRKMDHNGDYETLPSVDRIDSNGHYEWGNIQLVVQAANYAKNVLTTEAFIAMCRDVAKHRAN